jgi:hypothetical protein
MNASIYASERSQRWSFVDWMRPRGAFCFHGRHSGPGDSDQMRARVGEQALNLSLISSVCDREHT